VWYLRCCPNWRKYWSPAAHFLVLCYRSYYKLATSAMLKYSTDAHLFV
jgi:hypothetical protein